jgi:eukaryotic-like serine/threonine-protein kinase
MSALSCPSCSSVVPAESRFCGTCGVALPPSSTFPTVNASDAPRRRPGDARFLPGVVVAGRYRIMGLLGRGGMGEVYRADDLKLGQPVALKFLPAGLESSPDRLENLLEEVRTARQVSHANVCRIYDVGEAEGLHFLSMEYVDGEDLASLLRRIGHLPKDKAIQIARQICAGLAASHEIGVLHRDLKPANIMIDGRGRARITDFGLAGFAGEIDVANVAGTPAYMAPEQLEGKDVTVRSDVYALGLVLYELFTGKQAFRAGSLEERRRESHSAPSSPSSVMDGFDPAVERVILRCLEADPKLRPSSALAVAAALPGGDPIAAALAAGETPSPEMVAEAGGTDAAPAAVSWGALAVFVVAVVATLALQPRTTLLGLVPLEKPPEFLQERAREILVAAGHGEKAVDSLFTFDGDGEYLEDLGQRGKGWDALRSLPPSAVRFWYRQSRQEISRYGAGSIGDWITDPPNDQPGMARVELDPDGRLLSFLVVPGEKTGSDPSSEKGSDPDWDPLLRATGVDPPTVAPAASEWAPPVYADRRMAWTGTWPGKPELPVRIEAAAAGGKPVALRVVLPWTRPSEQPATPLRFWSRASRVVEVGSYVVVIVAASIVALRNVRRGRGDRRGALRLALYIGAVRMAWFLGAHHVASADEQVTFAAHLAYAMQRVGIVYVFYLALEPYARMLWPRMLTSWVRVLEGRFQDPLVGRDLLIGAAAGAVIALNSRLAFALPAMLGDFSAIPHHTHWSFDALRGPISALVALLAIHTQQLVEIIYPLTLLLVFRLLLRRTDLAVVAVTLVALILFLPDSGSLPPYVVMIAASLTIGWLVLFRSGLLAFATLFCVFASLNEILVPLHPGSWYGGAALLALAFAVAPAAWGFWISRPRRMTLREEVLAPAGR